MSENNNNTLYVLVSCTRFVDRYTSYVRRKFAANPEVKTTLITALGFAIPSAIAVAKLLSESEIVSIVDIDITYNFDKSMGNYEERRIACISIQAERNTNWVPTEQDLSSTPSKEGKFERKGRRLQRGRGGNHNRIGRRRMPRRSSKASVDKEKQE